MISGGTPPAQERGAAPDDESAPPSSATDSAPVTPCRILVVDDDSVFRQFLGAALEREGYIVQLARDGREALLRIESSQPDLIVTDLCMPEVDGLELMTHLRRRPRPIPIIAVSGLIGISPTLLDVARRLGARRTFVKPFPIENLVAAILELVPRPS